MNARQMHHRLVQELTTIGLRVSQPQCRNIALLCQALAVGANCHLATLALGMPVSGQREHLVQRLRRLLKQERLRPAECYGPVVRQVFAHWPGREVNLVMDRTDLEDRWSILLLGAAYQQRVLPLTWEVFRHGGSSVQQQISLLERVQPYLPRRVERVHFFGDSECRGVDLQRKAQGYGWHWQVGLKSDLCFHSGDGDWRPLRDLGVQTGERRYLQGITLTREHAFAPVNLIADWPATQDHPGYWSLDLPANRQAWRRGRKRYWVEPTFRDWKSYGFDLERSQIDDPNRLDVLLLGMALATVWLIHVGDWLTGHGRRRWLEAPHQNDYSLFRLGRDYLQRWQTLGGPVPVGFTVSQAG